MNGNKISINDQYNQSYDTKLKRSGRNQKFIENDHKLSYVPSLVIFELPLCTVEPGKQTRKYHAIVYS